MPAAAPARNDGTEVGNASRVWTLADHQIGGAIVRRGFNRGSTYLKAGTKLTADEVRSIPMVNRRALSVSGALDIYPIAPEPLSKGAGAVPDDAERYVIHQGGGRYDVILGRKLNDEPLTKAQAEALAEAD